MYSAELVYDRMACGDEVNEVNHNSYDVAPECCHPWPVNADGYITEMGKGDGYESYGHISIMNDSDNTSNSAMEHQRSIILEQGYDSLLSGALE